MNVRKALEEVNNSVNFIDEMSKRHPSVGAALSMLAEACKTEEEKLKFGGAVLVISNLYSDINELGKRVDELQNSNRALASLVADKI